ncbi:MAG TPA: beta-N-acetylhexosaminidase, partial [Clostridia bacterium]|nr:beta-N-acetylhexosaminidase [Clostridia bacterium]
MDVPIMIGQHLFTGFDGTVMAEDFCRKLRESKIGNIILFARNIGTAAQVRALCGEIQRLVLETTGQPALIAIDQEGGVVSRLGADCAVIPSAMAVSATGDPELAYRAGLLTGSELAAMGINFNLAPVLDINSNPDNPVIGARSYGSSPGQAIPPALGMARGLREAGVLACAKHFPGHGDTAVDSHVGLPKVDKTLEQLLDCELKPFEAAIWEGIPAVMSSHILFPRLEQEKLPATMSRGVMRDLLRGKLGFEGLVVSDCMMMRAIADHYGTLDGILAAIRAGVDMVFVSHSIDLAMEASGRLQQEWQAGRLDRA